MIYVTRRSMAASCSYCSPYYSSRALTRSFLVFLLEYSTYSERSERVYFNLTSFSVWKDNLHLLPYPRTFGTSTLSSDSNKWAIGQAFILSFTAVKCPLSHQLLFDLLGYSCSLHGYLSAPGDCSLINH